MENTHQNIHNRDYSALVTAVTLVLCTIIVYFGRIYFPENFQPETVSFFDNLWVLVVGLCFVISMFSLCGLGIWWIGRELLRDIKSLISKNREL